MVAKEKAVPIDQPLPTLILNTSMPYNPRMMSSVMPRNLWGCACGCGDDVGGHAAIGRVSDASESVWRRRGVREGGTSHENMCVSMAFRSGVVLVKMQHEGKTGIRKKVKKKRKRNRKTMLIRAKFFE